MTPSFGRVTPPMEQCVGSPNAVRGEVGCNGGSGTKNTLPGNLTTTRSRCPVCRNHFLSAREHFCSHSACPAIRDSRSWRCLGMVIAVCKNPSASFGRAESTQRTLLMRREYPQGFLEPCGEAQSGFEVSGQQGFGRRGSPNGSSPLLLYSYWTHGVGNPEISSPRRSSL